MNSTKLNIEQASGQWADSMGNIIAKQLSRMNPTKRRDFQLKIQQTIDEIEAEDE